MELQGKIALVTGAARRVGRAIAIGLAKAGCDIGLHYSSSAQAAEATAGEIRALGRRCELLPADLADPSQIEEMFQHVAQAFGRLDVLVNSASTFNATPLDALTAEQWDREQAVNVRAPALCIRHAIALMPSGGRIVNITDSAAERGRAAFAAYCASKAALLNLTKSAAKALAPRGITVNSVAPGAVAWPEGIEEAGKNAILRRVPMNRLGSPEDITAAVVFLASSDYVTGQCLRVDGGWNMA